MVASFPSPGKDGASDAEPAYSAIAVPRRGPGSRRAIAVGTGLALILTVAIAKPWQSAAPPERAVRPVSVDAKVSAAPVRDARPSATPVPRHLGAIPALERHDAWGIRLIPTTRRLEQIWLPAPTPMPDGVPDLEHVLVRSVLVTADQRPVRLLGLSTPRDVDVERVTVATARQHEPGGPLTLDEIPFHRWDPRSLLLAPADRQDWSPGIYQIRIDLGESETAITVAIVAGPHSSPGIRGSSRETPSSAHGSVR
jgi:hypothetical protein